MAPRLVPAAVETPEASQDAEARPAQSTPHKGASRLWELQGLATLGRAPRFPRWLGEQPPAGDASAVTDLRERFGSLTVPSPANLVVLPPWVPDADRWIVLQERLLLSAPCLCFNGAGPGAVPDGGAIPGVPLLVDKRPTQIRLDWSASCNGAAEDYGIYQGTIGSWYSHAALDCSTSGALFTLLPTPPGNKYFLVVPEVAQAEGSYGTDSHGRELPQGRPACRSVAIAEACP